MCYGYGDLAYLHEQMAALGQMHGRHLPGIGVAVRCRTHGIVTHPEARS